MSISNIELSKVYTPARMRNGRTRVELDARERENTTRAKVEETNQFTSRDCHFIFAPDFGVPLGHP